MKRSLVSVGLVLVVAVTVAVALVGGRGATARTAALPTPRPTVSDYAQMTTSERRRRRRSASRSDAAASRRSRSRARTTSARSTPPVSTAAARRSRSSTPTAATRSRTTCTSSTTPSACRRCAARRAWTCASGHADVQPARAAGLAGDQGARRRRATAPGYEDKTAWALEVSLDVETAHAIAPGANILLVTTPTAETLGVQGFPQMMNAEQYVVDHHLADVISQSFASAEEAFGSTKSLQNLRTRVQVAPRQNGVTVLGSSGDSGTANGTKKTPVGKNPGSDIDPVPDRRMARVRPAGHRRRRHRTCAPNANTRRLASSTASTRPRAARTLPARRRSCWSRRGRRLQPRVRPAVLPGHAAAPGARDPGGLARRPRHRAAGELARRARWCTSRCRPTGTAA